MIPFKKLEVSPFLNIYVLVALICVSALSAQKIDNKDKDISTSSPKENPTFGKDEFLEFIKGKLKLSARINVGGSNEENCFNDYMFQKYNEFEWNYQNSDGWEEKLCAEGINQSPVNLPRIDTVKKNMGAIKFHRYSSSPDVIRMKNTGKTIMMDLGYPKIRTNNNSKLECGENVLLHTNEWPHISGGPLKGKYNFHQIHFHWGTSDSIGSEHSVSLVYFPLEVQLIHYNSKYKSMDEAIDKENGIAILSTFFQLLVESNPKLDHFVNQLPKVVNSSSKVLLDVPFPLSYFVPNTNEEYYMYNGSLTAPPCTENVAWIVFKNTIGIRLQQLDKFRQIQMPQKKVQVQNKNNQWLKDTKTLSRLIGNNFRTTQRNQENSKYVVYENIEEKELALQLKTGIKTLPSSACSNYQWIKQNRHAIVFSTFTILVGILR